MSRARLSPPALCLLLVASAVGAHHSRAPYDMTTEIVIEGTVADLEWTNPHVSMTVQTEDADGAPILQAIEVMSVSEARAMGLSREAIAPGSHVVVRAHPGRRGPGARAVGIDVRTSDGRLLPLNTGAGFAIAPEGVTEAQGLEGRWAPSVTEFNASFTSMAQWPFTEAARASLLAARAQSDEAVLGLCADYPPPLLSVFPDLREIRIGSSTVEMRFEAQGQNLLRVVHLDQISHPKDVAPSLLGHSIGHWEQQTLVVDTVAFEPNPIGIMVGIPSSSRKHLVERLTLTQDRLHLRYDVMLDDPAGLTAPATVSVLWDYRPDLEPSGVPCNPEVARKSLE